jgi:hypothetical protein
MSTLNAQIDTLKYGGFTSYGAGQASSLKPGLYNQYNKDVYQQISQYSNRELQYFDDKIRYRTVYDEDLIKDISKDHYKENRKKPQMKVDLDSYQYNHDPNILEMFKENSIKNEESIRSK